MWGFGGTSGQPDAAGADAAFDSGALRPLRRTADCPPGGRVRSLGSAFLAHQQCGRAPTPAQRPMEARSVAWTLGWMLVSAPMRRRGPLAACAW